MHWSQLFHWNKLNVLTILKAVVARVVWRERKGECGWKTKEMHGNICILQYISLFWVKGPSSKTAGVTPRPPAVCPAWVLFCHPSSSSSFFSSWAKIGLRYTTFSKGCATASVCVLRSKCETNSETCGTACQSCSAICYPHNHPIKRKNRMWWILRALRGEETEREGAQ